MANASARSTHHGSIPPLVGRERELALLRERLAAALASHGTLVLLSGEAGIGKTALAEALLHDADAQGALVLVGRCYDLSETPPYGPWRELLDRTPRDADLPILPTAVLPLDREGAALASQEAIFARVQAYLAALAARRPMALLLEDLHWADPASLDLLRVVARRLTDLPLLLLATDRADEIGQEHPLYALLPRLVREARADRLDLHPLDRGAIGTLVSARYALDASEADRLTTYLAGRTEGNALFLGELLRTLEGEGVLAPSEGDWHLGDLARVPVPPLLRQVIAGRLARFDPATGRLLAVAAVIGQEVPLSLWAAIGEVDEADLLDHIDQATQACLLVEMPDGAGVRFAHALIREALYDGLLAPRRRRVHWRVAEVLAAAPNPDPDAVADHFFRAGDARAAAWLLRAGERAQAAYAWATAIARYEVALALTSDGDDAALRARLLLRLGGLLRMRDPQRGAATLDEAARCATGRADPALAARIQLYRGLVRCFLGELSAGVALLREAGAALEALPPEARRGELIVDAVDATNDVGTVVAWLAQTGHLTEAAALGARVLTQENSGGATGRDGAPFADAYMGLGHIHAHMGRPGAARAAFARARQLNAAAGHPYQAGGAAFDLLQDVVLVYEADDPAACAVAAAAAEADWAATDGEVRDFPARVAWLPVLVLAGGLERGKGARGVAAGGDGQSDRPLPRRDRCEAG